MGISTDNSLAFNREQQAALNNLRAILNRQLRPTSTVDPVMVSDLILKNAELMRENGLASELLDYLTRIREKFSPDQPAHTKLSVEIATTLDAIEGRQSEAADLFQEILKKFEASPENDPLEQARAELAYGRYLVNRSQLQSAEQHYQKALGLLEKNPTEAAVARNELGRVLVGQGRFGEALSHFEYALAAFKSTETTTQRARTLHDLAAALVQVGELERAERHLTEALDLAAKQGLWTLRANVRRQIAYIYQARAEKSTDLAAAQPYLDEAERLLNQTVADLLPLHNTLDLAVVYHDLGRLEAQQRNFVDAEAHVRQSIEMFGRLGNLRNEAVAEVTLGPLLVLKNGDIAAGNEHVHRALQLADKVGDQFTLRQAAETLTRLHHLQVNRAKTQSPEIRTQVIDQLSFSRARLAEFSLPEAAQHLDDMITELEAIEKS